MNHSPLKTALAYECFQDQDNSTLALPSDQKMKTGTSGRQRVQEQVMMTVKRQKSKSSQASTLSHSNRGKGRMPRGHAPLPGAPLGGRGGGRAHPRRRSAASVLSPVGSPRSETQQGGLLALPMGVRLHWVWAGGTFGFSIGRLRLVLREQPFSSSLCPDPTHQFPSGLVGLTQFEEENRACLSAQLRGPSLLYLLLLDGAPAQLLPTAGLTAQPGRPPCSPPQPWATSACAEGPGRRIYNGTLKQEAVSSYSQMESWGRHHPRGGWPAPGAGSDICFLEKIKASRSEPDLYCDPRGTLRKGTLGSKVHKATQNRYSFYSSCSGQKVARKFPARPPSCTSRQDPGSIPPASCHKDLSFSHSRASSKICSEDIECSGLTIPKAVQYLSSQEEKCQAIGAYYIQHTCFQDESAKQQVYQLGGICKLVDLLRSPNQNVQQAAAGALRNLVFRSPANKLETRRQNGIREAVSLLRRTGSTEIQKQLTGLLWNLSSADELKEELVAEALPVLADRVIIPFSGWCDGNSNLAREAVDPEVFFNATGCLRNLSSADAGRQTMRNYTGLIDSLLAYVQNCVAASRCDDKSVENCMCVLHNLSYRLDAEVPTRYRQLEYNARNAYTEKSSTGCFSNKSDRMMNNNYDCPLPEEEPSPTGSSLLYHSDAVRTYLNLMGKSPPQPPPPAQSLQLQSRLCSRSPREPVPARNPLWPMVPGPVLAPDCAWWGEAGDRDDGYVYGRRDVWFAELAGRKQGGRKQDKGELGAKQDLPAVRGWVEGLRETQTNLSQMSSGMSQLIGLKEKGLPQIARLLQSGNSDVVRSGASLLSNMSRHPVLHRVMGNQVFPEVTRLLTSHTGNTSNSEDILSSACYTVRNLMASQPQVAKQHFSSSMINNVINLCRSSASPRAAEAARLLLSDMWASKELQGILRQQGLDRNMLGTLAGPSSFRNFTSRF
uniref:Plakophilin-1 n=1 Tax=Camelus bactrianus TaxID=9837 RepID=A0A9W3G7B4_CAMBA|nr:plakophilin-1 [Camelus bactrianus]